MASVTDIGTLLTQSPGICDGRLQIAGTGVSVLRIVGWYKMGMDPEKIAEQYGHLSLAQVYAALSYYHANRDEIEAEMAAEEAEYDHLAAAHRATRGDSQ